MCLRSFVMFTCTFYGALLAIAGAYYYHVNNTMPYIEALKMEAKTQVRSLRMCFLDCLRCRRALVLRVRVRSSVSLCLCA